MNYTENIWIILFKKLNARPHGIYFFKDFFGVCSIKNISDKNLSLERLRVLLP